MRLRRRPPAAPTRRQRLRSETVQNQSPPSFSYRARRSSEEPPKVARPQLARFWLQRSGLIILLAAAIISTVNVLSLSAAAKVLPLGTDANRTVLHDPSVYKTAVDQLLASSVWNRNKLTINTSQINQHMLSQFPELASASVTLPLLAHRPVVYIAPAQPAVILVTSSGSFMIDTNGKALIKAADVNAFSRTSVPVIRDQSGLQLQLNRQALPAPHISFIQTVLAELAAKNIAATTMTLPPTASELDVQIGGQPYVVKFNLQNNTPREQAGTFLATIAQLQKQNIAPTAYVDVRVEGRAYYQ